MTPLEENLARLDSLSAEEIAELEAMEFDADDDPERRDLEAYAWDLEHGS